MEKERKVVPLGRYVAGKKGLLSFTQHKQGRQADKAGRLGEVMCPLELSIFLQRPLTELTFTARQAVRNINQSTR